MSPGLLSSFSRIEHVSLGRQNENVGPPTPFAYTRDYAKVCQKYRALQQNTPRDNADPAYEQARVPN